MSRRGQGDGGLHWDESRKRWIASITIGYDGRGKRRVRRRSAKTKSEAGRLLRDMVREKEAGRIADLKTTVADSVNSFIEYGIASTDEKTQVNYEGFARLHIVPGSRRDPSR